MENLIETYRDPLFIKWYVNNEGQKISVERNNLQFRIVGDQIILPEVPDEFYGIDITDMIQLPVGRLIELENEFVVDWTSGLIKFHPDKNGTNVTINSYWARGAIYYPASRIYLRAGNPAIGQDFLRTIDDVTDGALVYLDKLYEFQWKGDYNSETTYFHFNLVDKNGWIWFCITDNEVEPGVYATQGEEPSLESDHWVLISNYYIHPDHTGDVTSDGDGATTIVDNAVTTNKILDENVTLAKIQDIPTNRILGRITVDNGIVEELTDINVRTIINVEDGANNYTHPNHNGDVTSVNDGTTTITDKAVTLAKIQDIATARILGRVTPDPGITEELEASDVRTMINVADGANAYVHPNHSGDVTSVADGVATITDKAVTLAKIQDIATARILGRVTADPGVTELLTDSDVRTLLNVADGANNYSHPASHALSMIDETTTLKILTDVERAQIASMLAYLKNRVHVGMLVKDATAGQTHADADAYSFKFNLQEGLVEVNNLLKEFATEANIILGSGATSPLDATDDTIIYAIWLQNDSGTITIESLAGTAAPAVSAVAPSNSDIETEINNSAIIWYRLANFKVTRVDGSNANGVADNTVRNKI
jgi:hypothetical protein